LFNFSFIISVPAGWSYHYQFNQSLFLEPGETIIINFYILPLTTITGSFNIQISVRAFVYEDVYHCINISKTETLSVTVYPKTYENEIIVGLIIFGIIVGGIGIGVCLHFLNRAIKRTSRRLKVIQDLPDDKQKSGKK